MSSRNISFSVDPYNFVRALLADPALKQKVYQAVKDGPATSMTEKLGYSNLAAEGEEAAWATLFPATVKDKKVGDEGLFHCAKKSGFPLMRLREQTRKAQKASETPTETTPVAPVDMSGIDIAALAKSLGISAEQAAQAIAAQLRPDTEVDPLVNAVEEILNQD